MPTIEEWWPRLRPQTRTWLVANNGDVVPDGVRAEIAAVGGPAPSDAWWVPAEPEGDASADPGGRSMLDDAVDWIEETASADDGEG